MDTSTQDARFRAGFALRHSLRAGSVLRHFPTSRLGNFFDRGLKLFCRDGLGEVKQESGFPARSGGGRGVEPSYGNSRRRPRRLT